MLKRAKEKQAELIEKAIQHIYQKLSESEAKLIEKFIKHYFLSASPEDLIKFSVIDLYGLILSHWHFISYRQPQEAKVRVYNPQFEQHGWQSTHSVIEIIQEDMPFLLDSIRLELNRRGINLHLILHTGNLEVMRDDKGHITDLKIIKKKNKEGTIEAPIFIEFDKQSDEEVLEDIKSAIISILAQVRLCVHDWPNMIENMNQVIHEIQASTTEENQKDFLEVVEFLRWLREDHFTFLGYCQVTLQDQEGKQDWALVKDSSLGILRLGIEGYFDNLQDIPEDALKEVLSKEPILLGKTNRYSKVHRPANPDLVAVKRFNQQGEVIGQHYFIGLYTNEAYNRSSQMIPLLSQKVYRILKKAEFPITSHDGKTMLNILETIPRDDLIQGSIDELHRIAMGILYMQERRRIKLFIRKDKFCHFFSCLVFVPRDKFNSSLRIAFSKILEEELKGSFMSFNTRFSESVLCRIHILIQIDPKQDHSYDELAIEERLKEAARTWEDNLKESLLEHFGEEEGNRLISLYANAFPPGYRASFLARTAVYDISHIESLNEENPLEMSFYRPMEEPDEYIRFKLFHRDGTIALSDVIPMLEYMGLRVINERPHQILDKQGVGYWINDFGMVHESGRELNVEAVKDVFQEAFYNIWFKLAESDGFNRLVLRAGLQWQEVAMLRAYGKYLWQIGFTFSQSYLEEALAKHHTIARQLVELFILRFDPTLPQDTKNERTQAIRKKIKADLELVDSLDEDRILRRYMQVIMATIRTNYFQLQEDGKNKPYLSIKLDSSVIPELPLPRPMFEIFVYSPRVEGIHLRGAKVARGGLRWSDRREDFRTEVLGLMKAQQVKNAVIVPLGAKGGFVPKTLNESWTRDETLKEVVCCYQTFIRGLLDITDNIVNTKVVPRKNVVRYDSDDPYLVVAADKGTATFSDIANDLSQAYGFWLGDAFASGGSSGYDHKKIGITARGAWESVKRHFMEMNVDIQTTNFTVVGIGDMSGDVFGNGMLLSEHIMMVGAFNHMHIFIDPSPDPKVSFEERKRLFELPRSTWMDYNQELISKGGGIFSRAAKSIPVSPEMKALFGLHQDKIIPNDLIRAMLKSNVDLLWNGGIGTYVKATAEHNSEIGDKANDALRVNGADLQAKVVGEGGNLGFSQLGRVEYAQKGGRINTDAIDNSGGVNCSDNEVNIKILLNAVMTKGDLTLKQRNQLLESMTEDVADQVLKNNRDQTRALSVASLYASKNINMFIRLMEFLETEFNLNRSIEFLPDNESLLSRKALKQGLTRPELAVLLAYCKTWLKQELLASDIPEDPNILPIVETAFPEILREKYQKEMYAHRLKREIIVMQLANRIVNFMGMTFVTRLQDETGATAPQVVCSYMLARDVFSEESFYKEVEDLNFSIDSHLQLELMYEFNRLIRRASRWFLRHSRKGIDIYAVKNEFKKGVDFVTNHLRANVKGEAKDYLESSAKEYMDAKLSAEFAYKAASIPMLSSALDIAEVSMTYHFPLEQVLAAYTLVGARLELGWFREQIKQHPVSTNWDALARSAFRDDLDSQQRSLTINVLQMEGEVADVEAKLEAWFAHHKTLVDRFKHMLSELKGQTSRNYTMYSVALRELLDLSQASQVSFVTTRA